jgi:serine/threonine-protein kinase
MERQIGRYQVLDEIASGGQGAVFRVFDPETGQIVALKVLHASLSNDSNYVARFRREASLASSIDHPSVVKIFEVGQDGDQHFMASPCNQRKRARRPT